MANANVEFSKTLEFGELVIATGIADTGGTRGDETLADIVHEFYFDVEFDVPIGPSPIAQLSLGEIRCESPLGQSVFEPKWGIRSWDTSVLNGTAVRVTLFTVARHQSILDRVSFTVYAKKKVKT